MTDYKTLYAETKKLSVLLVEDHALLRKEMTEVLEDMFYSVTAAVDGVEALDYYIDTFEKENEKFDLIISDIQMPNMNGVELTKNIRKIDEKQAIIILSAYTDSEYLLEFINIGISRFLTKPIQQDELFETLYNECKKINLANENANEDEERMMTLDLGEGYIWHKATSTLKQDDENIELTKHELVLLQFFTMRHEVICSNFDIIDYFYTENVEISEKNIRNLVFKLRQKIPEECIQNVYGLGYKFIVKP